MQLPRLTALALLPLLSAAPAAHKVENATPAAEIPTYSYATAGALEQRRTGELWRVLLDETNLGGKELELAELTLKAGTIVPAHTHESLEIIYVLSGAFGHEVNGHYYLLRPGMVGVVRPGDHVRHLVPGDHDAKLLLIWAPAGEAKRVIDYAKATPIQPLPESPGPR